MSSQCLEPAENGKHAWYQMAEKEYCSRACFQNHLLLWAFVRIVVQIVVVVENLQRSGIYSMSHHCTVIAYTYGPFSHSRFWFWTPTVSR